MEIKNTKIRFRYFSELYLDFGFVLFVTYLLTYLFESFAKYNRKGRTKFFQNGSFSFCDLNESLSLGKDHASAFYYLEITNHLSTM